MATIDLSKLPPPALIVTLDFETILAALKADLLSRANEVGVDLAPVLALESEPLVKLLEVSAYRELVKTADFNTGARGTLLPYALGDDLSNVVVNLGVQREDGESDDALRARALLAPSGWSTAGPENAYRFHALSASPLVADVSASSPTPGQVRVVVLSTAGDGVADADLLATVLAALNDQDVRPLTDQVVVASASVTTYDVTAALTIGSGPDPDALRAAAIAAVQAYGSDQRKLGRKVARNAIIGRLMQPGVIDLVLDAPADDLVADPEVAYVLGAVNLTLAVGG